MDNKPKTNTTEDTFDTEFYNVSKEPKKNESEDFDEEFYMAEDEDTAEDEEELEAEEEEEEAEEEEPEEEEPAEEEPAEEEAPKGPFKLTAPANLEEIMGRICCKRGRKLIFAPKEVIIDGTYTVLGTDKKNEEGIKIKDVLDAEIKEGVKLGYLDKFDGLKTSEIKEEYEDDIVYEFAEQEFKKTGLVLDGDTIKVYLFDWDLKACHHVGYLDEAAVAALKPYLEKRDDYSFGICGIITGGKAKRVTKDPATGKVTVTKEKCGNIGMEIDVSILKRKD